jgi:hypothetical protein
MKLIRNMALLAGVFLIGAGTAMAQAAPPAPTAAPRPPASRTPHPTAGKTDCLSCHGVAATEHISKVPADHTYANTACLRCHRLSERMPTNSKHAMDAPHARCATCHVANSPTGAGAMPAFHAGWHPTTCSLCHQQAPPG